MKSLCAGSTRSYVETTQTGFAVAFPFADFLPDCAEHHFKHGSVPDHSGEAEIFLAQKHMSIFIVNSEHINVMSRGNIRPFLPPPSPWPLVYLTTIVGCTGGLAT